MPSEYPVQPVILGVFAHPDDEGSIGGCLAKYAAAGVRAYVACATRGDGADAKIADPTIATRETLGHVRSQELACACEKLGAQPPIFLGYQDGELDRLPVEAAALAVARVIREVRPSIVITHDPGGGYGHPDHLAVNAFTTRAFSLAGDPAVDLALAPFAPVKLYYTAVPRSFMERVPGFRNRRAEIRGQILGFVGVPDEQITTAVEIRDWLPTKLAALSCHRTQFEFDPETKLPKFFLTTVPEPERSELFGYERFVLAQANLPAGALNGRETDLLAGL